MWLDSSNNHLKAAPVTLYSTFKMAGIVCEFVPSHSRAMGSFMVENMYEKGNKRKRLFFANVPRDK